MSCNVRLYFCLAVAVGLGGCSAHSPMILKNTTDVAPAAATKQLSPHSRPILIVRGALPSTVRFELIAQVDAERIWYGSTEAGAACEAAGCGCAYRGGHVASALRLFVGRATWSWKGSKDT
jgi:hypothetical protein